MPQENGKNNKEPTLLTDVKPEATGGDHPWHNSNLETLFNGVGINALLGKRQFKEIDKVNGQMEQKTKVGSLFVSNYKNLKKEFNTTTNKFLNYSIMLLAKNNPHKQGTKDTINRTVRIKISDYQRERGLKSYDTTIRQAINDAEILFASSYKWKEKHKKKPLYITYDMRILSAKATIEHGDVFLTFTPETAEYLVYSYIMKLPRYYWKASDVASAILFKIATLKRIKLNKKNQDTENISISIINLLDAIVSIPCYDEVMKSKERHAGRRIIRPLERGLDELQKKGIYNWQYSNKNKEPLKDEQLYGEKSNAEGFIEWKTFKDLYILFTPPVKLMTKND